MKIGSIFSGLRFRIAVVPAVVLAVFIVVTELSVSVLTRITMTRYCNPIVADQITEQSETTSVEAIDNELKRLRRPVLFYLVIGAVTVLGIILFAIGRMLVRPLQRLNNAFELVGEGEFDTKIPVSGAKEIAEIGLAFNRMTEKLLGQQAELTVRMERIEKASQELKDAQDRLVRSAKLASVGTLAAGVAHEIGNPLAGLLGLTESLQAGIQEEDRARFLELMKSEILRIDRIIGDLLSYARTPEALSSEGGNLSDAMDRVRDLLAAQSLFDNIELLLPKIEKPVITTMTDDDLTQFFLNIFLNAAEAMKGKGSIAVQLELLSDWKKTPQTLPVGAVRVSIQDNGPGIPEEFRDKIFDPFFTTGKKGEGCGLGLSVCQNLCERSGGELILSISDQTGACFIATLPLYTSAKTTV